MTSRSTRSSPAGTGARSTRGTVDVAAAVGLACAARITMKELAEVNDRVLDHQEKLIAALSLLPGCQVTGVRACACPDRARDL